jgi:hypothetical protein
MKQTKEIIKEVVRQEIREMFADSREIINEAIRTYFLQELKAEVRNSILMALEDLLEESPESPGAPGTPKAEETSKLPERSHTEAVQSETIGETDDHLPPTPEMSTDTCDGENQKDHHVDYVDHNHIPEEVAVGDFDKTNGTTGEGEEDTTGEGEGRYLYCIVECKEKMSLGKIGIDGNEVYTIPYKDLAAVVHNCPEEPYKSDEQEIMTNWVLTHQQVTDAAWEKFGTVIPLGFDTIIQKKEGRGPDENIQKWMEDDYDHLKNKFEKIRGKAEYGVQIFWNPKIISKKIEKESQGIKDLQAEMNTKPKGVAYMYRQKLENLLKTEMEKEADRCFKDFYEKIKQCVDEIKVEKTKKPEGDKQMLLNLACLLPKEKSEILGDELEKIHNMEGFTVRFTGPWPTYGFV